MRASVLVDDVEVAVARARAASVTGMAGVAVNRAQQAPDGRRIGNRRAMYSRGQPLERRAVQTKNLDHVPRALWQYYNFRLRLPIYRQKSRHTPMAGVCFVSLRGSLAPTSCSHPRLTDYRELNALSSFVRRRKEENSRVLQRSLDCGHVIACWDPLACLEISNRREADVCSNGER